MDNNIAIDFARLTPAQSALLARIRVSLATNSLAVERAITVLYANQTTDERAVSAKGFNSADASRLSYYARWVGSGRHLTGHHLDRARATVGKYWRQLLRAAVAKAQVAQGA